MFETFVQLTHLISKNLNKEKGEFIEDEASFKYGSEEFRPDIFLPNGCAKLGLGNKTVIEIRERLTAEALKKLTKIYQGKKEQGEVENFIVIHDRPGQHSIRPMGSGGAPLRGFRIVPKETFLRECEPANEEKASLGRKISEEDLSNDLQRLLKNRIQLQAQLEQALQKGSTPPEEVERLRQDLNILNHRITELTNKKNTAKEEKEIEGNWENRIKDAFKELKESSATLNNEYTFLKGESWGYLIATGLLILIVVVWACYFYCRCLPEVIAVQKWYHVFPYYLPIPIAIALIWLFIIQKNRANKLSIILGTEIFRIHYLEGLLLAINKLSPSSEDSINRINAAIGEMTKSYLHQVEHFDLAEKEIGAIEKGEFNAQPYISLLNKLIESQSHGQ